MPKSLPTCSNGHRSDSPQLSARLGLTSANNANANTDRKIMSNNTSSQSVIEQLIEINGTIAKQPCLRPMLIDGGSSCNFISRAFAQQIQHERWRLPQRIRVKMANGSTAFCTEILHDVEISVPNYRGLHNLVVMPFIDGYDVVLGTPFLTSSGASIHYRTSTITWETTSSANTSTVTTNVTACQRTDSNPFSCLPLDDDEISFSSNIATSSVNSTISNAQPSTTDGHAAFSSEDSQQSIAVSATKFDRAVSSPSQLAVDPIPARQPVPSSQCAAFDVKR
ncbi:MAG TPA: retropepsin-like aspartic protease, partial [Allocoleopsis sp.]